MVIMPFNINSMTDNKKR